MGWRTGVAAGLVALWIGGTVPAAHGAAVRGLEAERMSGSGGSVLRAAGASGGRALTLRRRSAAQAVVRTQDVRALVVRARLRGCRRGSLLLSLDGGVARRARPGRRWARHRIRASVPAGRHRVAIRFAAPRRRCRAHVDRISFRSGRADSAPPASVAPLRTVPLGTAVDLHDLRHDAGYEQALRDTYVSITPENEMKMDWLQPARGRWNFAAADALVAYAGEHGLAIRGHALIFGEQTPPWVSREWLFGNPARTMRTHIHTVMRRYAGRVGVWDVVNEAFDDYGGFKANAWSRMLGPEYVEMAFRYAREADPTAKLFYNEINAETDNPKRAATLRLVERLKEKGLIDGVGLQMHTAVGWAPTRRELESTLREYQRIGVEVEITEMDVVMGGLDAPESIDSGLLGQADAYRDAATACAAVAACKRFTVWGVADAYSWKGMDQRPLLLDGALQAKPALHAVRQAIG